MAFDIMNGEEGAEISNVTKSVGCQWKAAAMLPINVGSAD